MLERLQKILSSRGIASRRHAEQFILDGRVTVNGKKAVLGQKADAALETIAVDGKPLSATQDTYYYLLNKPLGVTVTNISGAIKEDDTSQRSTTVNSGQTLRDILPQELRDKIFPVGRLDRETSGLLLLTNDGELALRLTHPRYDHEKEYEVTLAASISNGALQKLQNGITLDGTKTKPATVRRLSDTVFRLTITEGRNRQIRRMCQKVGSTVSALRRVRIASLSDDSLPPGHIRPLGEEEKVALLAAVGLY